MTLVARDLAFGFGGHRIGHIASLRLEAGEAVCLLGPNGAGKTTLFRTLLGLLPPVSGTVTLDGEDLATLGRDAIARRIAFVPQAAATVFDFPLLEIVEMGRVSRMGRFARPSRADTAIAREALERVGIAALAERSFGTVSGGERQLALVARALATGAGHIILDEPAAHLDFANQARLLQELKRLRAAGIAILLCSHDPDHVVTLGGRALLLDGGTAMAEGTVDEVLTAANLSRLYGVDVRSAAAWRPHA
ncbi:MAG TPA: ABC transporter ATP-binding protein [Usitatibacter sp.]|nr:ABC transporter ATP-binding protein [Usitatibacter sp.]